MDSRTPERPASPDAVEFVRFCYRRRRVGWPELYDEMCAVANRGLFRGWSVDDLGQAGIGFSLFEMPSLASLVARVIAEEQGRRLAARAAHAEAARTAPTTEAPGHHPTEDVPVDREADRRDLAAEPTAALHFVGASAGA